MIVRYIIHMKNGWSCKCFSDGDLFTNIEFALKENYQILAVERIIQ